MRANVYPTKECLKRMDPDVDVFCRRCRVKIETLGHVLDECPAGKGMRMFRHDCVVDAIADKASEAGCTVAREQLFEGTRGLLELESWGQWLS